MCCSVMSRNRRLKLNGGIYPQLDTLTNPLGGSVSSSQRSKSNKGIYTREEIIR